jgi:hypothetical protein
LHNKNAEFSKTIIGKPEKWLIEAASSIGLDVSGLSHEITNHFKNHVINRHGDPAKHGTATVTEQDFKKIPDMLKKPDIAIIGAVRWGIPCNIQIKIYKGTTYLYFEDILNSNRNKCLRGRTLYKVTRPLLLDEILKNVIRNDKTDISKAKIVIFSNKKDVQTAGSHPGGEA